MSLGGTGAVSEPRARARLCLAVLLSSGQVHAPGQAALAAPCRASRPPSHPPPPQHFVGPPSQHAVTAPKCVPASPRPSKMTRSTPALHRVGTVPGAQRERVRAE